MQIPSTWHADHESVTGLLTRGQYRERVILTPICSTYLAYSHGFQHIDTFMKKSAAGRPYYYSHYTDYYRYESGSSCRILSTHSACAPLVSHVGWSLLPLVNI